MVKLKFLLPESITYALLQEVGIHMKTGKFVIHDMSEIGLLCDS